MGAAASKAGTAGVVTREAGFLSYYEILEMRAQPDTTTVYDPTSRTYFSVNGNQWVGYDTPETMNDKVCGLALWLWLWLWLWPCGCGCGCGCGCAVGYSCASVCLCSWVCECGMLRSASYLLWPAAPLVLGCRWTRLDRCTGTTLTPCGHHPPTMTAPRRLALHA